MNGARTIDATKRCLAAAAAFALAACTSGTINATADAGRTDADTSGATDADPPGRDRPGADAALDADTSTPRTSGVLLFGGADGDGALADTWLWDGERWEELTPEAAPSPRIDHEMVYDQARDRVVLFGGRGEGEELLNDTWEWNGSSWEDVSPEGESPPARLWPAMAYDAGRERVVLFGGTTDGVEYGDDTWEWDGQSWEDVSPTAAVSPSRINHSMAYDPSGERVLMFGGDERPLELSKDTWAWDGERWDDISPSDGAPSERRDLALATDAVLGRVLLFGGINGVGQPRDDTWQWTGYRWEDVSPPAERPSARFFHAMAYDHGSERVVLFGGLDDGDALVPNDTWLWDGSRWDVASTTPAPSARHSHALSATPMP